MTINSNYRMASDEMAITSNVHCPTGYEAFMDTENGAIDYVCTLRAADSTIAMDNVKGVKASCPQGDLAVTYFSQSNAATHWTDMSVANEAAQCMDCAPNMSCITSDDNAFGQWCVGKDPTINWFDVNNGNLLVQMDDRRVSINQNYWCIDCNSEEFADGSCPFMSDYFPDH